MRPAASEADFIELVRTKGPAQTARILGITERNVHKRRVNIEAKLGYRIVKDPPPPPKEYPHRITATVPNGIVIVASDAHYWPEQSSLMHRALVKLCKEYKPKIVILNGDVIDAPQISRHARIGWESLPELADEIEAAKDRVHEIEKAAGRARKIWNLGNHDARFETRLANLAPQYARIHGVSLQDHFPLWEPAWSTWINDKVVVKHRFKGGIHAPRNNTLFAGKTMVTGHLHSAKIYPFDDYNGTRYGVDTGCIADTDAPQFVAYTEDSPKDWRSGFGVLTFKDGQMLQPELVLKWDEDHIQFRGVISKP